VTVRGYQRDARRLLLGGTDRTPEGPVRGYQRDARRLLLGGTDRTPEGPVPRITGAHGIPG